MQTADNLSTFPHSAITVGRRRTNNPEWWDITITHLDDTPITVPSLDPLLVDQFIEEMVLLLHDKELRAVQDDVENGESTHKHLLHDAELFALLKALASIRQDLERCDGTPPWTITLDLPEYDAFLTHGAWEVMGDRKTTFTAAMSDFLFPDVPPMMLNPSLAIVETYDGVAYSVGFDTETRHAFRISVRPINGQLASRLRL